MSGRERVLAYFGHVYRLRTQNGDTGRKYPLDALIAGKWTQIQCWEDVGYVAAQLVRHGIVVDHQSAMLLLQATEKAA